jgi:hypothetical protein
MPDGEVETSRPFVRDDRVFIASRFTCRGETVQVELPSHLIQPTQIIGISRTKPYFDSDREVA